MKILVTGSAGFVGYHLCRFLLERQFEGAPENITLTGLDVINDYYDLRIKYGRLKQLGISMQDIRYGEFAESQKYNNYRFIKLDVTDSVELDKLFDYERFDMIVHLAAQAGVRYSITHPRAYLDSNLIGFFNVLEACRYHDVKHLVYASSSSVYGWNERMPFSTSDNVDHPVSLYAATKKSNELLAHSYSALYKLPTTGLRFFTVYGPWGRPDMALFIFTQRILAGEPIDVYNFGNMRRDFTYIDDIVRGICYVLFSPANPNPEWSGLKPNPASSKAPYRVYNIGNNKPVKLLDFIEAIEKALGRQAIKNMLPLQPGDVSASHADVSDLIRDFDYKPKTNFRVGIKKFIEWYLDFYDV